MDITAKEKIAKIVQSGCDRFGQRGYARKLGVSLYAVQNWLECGSTPTVENLKKIASHAGYTFEEFMNFLDQNKENVEIGSLDKVLKEIRHLQKEDLVQVICEGTRLLAEV